VKDRDIPACAKCVVDVKICESASGQAPSFCPTLTREEVARQAALEYEKPAVREFARQASIQEGECYADRGAGPCVPQPCKSRVQETCEFARKMGFRRIGLAFCTGLRREAWVLTKILEAQGFQVVSVACKVGRTPKETIGVGMRRKSGSASSSPCAAPSRRP
jgi:uncharacterized metal-binding protein